MENRIKHFITFILVVIAIITAYQAIEARHRFNMTMIELQDEISFLQSALDSCLGDKGENYGF